MVKTIDVAELILRDAAEPQWLRAWLWKKGLRASTSCAKPLFEISKSAVCGTNGPPDTSLLDHESDVERQREVERTEGGSVGRAS